jgi:curli biogenesis system outer membrane secretion channel CsgG
MKCSIIAAVPLALFFAAGAWLVGCSSSKEEAHRDTLTADVGGYSQPPTGVNRPRVGVPPFKVTTGGGFGGGGDLDDLAADQMTTLLDNSGRFEVIERTQLKKLLDEQNLEGIVKSGELAQQGQVRGVDFLMLGRVTNLRVKQENKSNGFGLAQLGGIVNTGGLDVKNSDTVITTDCGVDIRLVNPTTGALLVSNYSEFSRTDSAHSMGVSILGANAESGASISLSDDDKGKILRLALDDALRKSLPKIDRFLRNQSSTACGAADVPAAPAPVAAPSPAPVAPAVPVAAPAAVAAPPSDTPGAVASKKFCPNCGHEVTAGAKFCPNCGAKLE